MVEENSPPKVEDAKAAASTTVSIRDLNKSVDIHEGTKSPFTALPSLISAAAILSYYGFAK